jgi:hypothetical protein
MEKAAKRRSSTTFLVMDLLALKALGPALQLHAHLLIELVLIEELRRHEADPYRARAAGHSWTGTGGQACPKN